MIFLVTDFIDGLQISFFYEKHVNSFCLSYIQQSAWDYTARKIDSNIY